jgi:hypothetical protein
LTARIALTYSPDSPLTSSCASERAVKAFCAAFILSSSFALAAACCCTDWYCAYHASSTFLTRAKPCATSSATSLSRAPPLLFERSRGVLPSADMSA